MSSVIVFIAKYVFVLSILIVGVFFLRLQKRQKISMLKLSVLAFPFAYLLSKILEKVIYDPRPFVVEHIKPLIAHAPDNGFPSDHTLLTAAIASVVFVYNKKFGILLYIVSFTIGLARILAQIHHLLDIIGSFAIAIVATASAYWVLKRFKYITKTENSKV